VPKSLSAVLNLLVTAGFAIALSAGASCAQSISGIVYDPMGGIVSGARVIVMQEYVKMQETSSSPTGEFSFATLPPGMYQLQIKQPRFSLFQTTITLEGNAPARIYAVLPLIRVMEEVRIKAALPPGAQKAVAAKRPRTIRVGGNVEPPQPLSPLRPAYPPGAASRGVEGPVVLFATLKADGTVSDVVVMGSPDSELQEEAIRALKKCRDQPAMLDGQLIETQMTIVFNFQLQ